MAHRSIRRSAIVAVAMLVPMVAACAPQGGGYVGPTGPVTDVRSIAFTRSSVSSQYCITAGNAAGTIIVSLDATNTTIGGSIIDVSFDRDPAAHLAVQQATTSAAFAPGSCHDVTFTALVSPQTTLIADFTITY